MIQNKKPIPLPYVSIVMPLRNEEHFIERCLNSIIDNDYPQDRVEIVIVDAMSTDQSRDIIKGIPKGN